MEDTACVVLDTTDDEELRKLIESEEEDSENVILPEEEDELSRVGWQVLTIIKVIIDPLMVFICVGDTRNKNSKILYFSMITNIVFPSGRCLLGSLRICIHLGAFVH